MFFLLFFSFFFSEKALEEVIDFHKKPNQFKEYKASELLEVSKAFNNAPELSSFFNYLKMKYKIDTAVETGTLQGNTTKLFSRLFDQVHTIEIMETAYNTAKESLHSIPNIHCHLGSSEKVLQSILPSLKNKPVLFYLDAHWEEHWPLLEELHEIAKTHKDNCIIVIDDIKVPFKKRIPYDKYGEHECSYEYVKAQLAEVFTDYSLHYVIPRDYQSRAKLVAIPKEWKLK